MRGLARLYPWFLVYLVADIGQTFAGMGHHWSTARYAEIWAWTEVLVLVGLVMATLELVGKLIAYYPGISELAKNGLGTLFGLAIVLGTIILGVDLLIPDKYAYLIPKATQVSLGMALRFLTFVSSALAIFLIGLALWYSVFPIRMRRNVKLHRVLLALYGGLIPFAALLVIEADVSTPQVTDATNLAMGFLQIGCLVTWCVGLTPSGEVEPEAPCLSIAEMELESRSYERLMDALKRRTRLAALFGRED